MSNYILIVDDDPNIAHLICLYLEKEGWLPVVARNGDEALHAFAKREYALVLLDIMMPGMDGMQVLSRIREKSRTPVIMITAKDQVADRIRGLDYGADDYLNKPFDMQELLARVRAVLRRYGNAALQTRRVEYNNLLIDLDGYKVYYRGRDCRMAPKEVELLHQLAVNPNITFSRKQLLETVWGFDYTGETRTVDVHIKRVREKLAQTEGDGWQIETVWSVGYKFEVNA